MLASAARLAFTPGAFLQKHCDIEDKPTKPSRHAGLQPVAD